MVDDKSDDSGPQGDLDRPKRAPPTLDLANVTIGATGEQQLHLHNPGAVSISIDSRPLTVCRVCSTSYGHRNC